MHTTNNNSQAFLTLLGLQPTSLLSYHGKTSPLLCTDSSAVMLLLHASAFLSFLLLLLNFFFFLLFKLFSYINNQATSKRDVQLNSSHCEDEDEPVPATGEISDKENLIADVILGGQGLLFLYEKSYGTDTLLTEQGRDSLEWVENNFVAESVYVSPLEDLPDRKHDSDKRDDPINGLPAPQDCPTPIVSTSDHNIFEASESKVDEFQYSKEKKDVSEKKNLFVVGDTHSDGEKFQSKEVPGGEENYGESLTGESTSKSSIEWRSSTIFRDSETEYPFSSSSRRSSSKWESYTVFRKYDEEMLFFDRISAQKLNETESLRSIKAHPRSISQRIAHKFMTKSKSTRGCRDPYQELESAYVAQICLTWEALNWNYNNFRLANSNRKAEESGCPARIAQQFQQFQVLLQRYIENEPYEHGRRPEVYARTRISSPKLLQVPEFQDSEGDERKEDMISRIPSWEFLVILEDAIQTFMNFLKADKEGCCRFFRSLIKKKQSLVDTNYLHLVKKASRKKKIKLEELVRRRKCLRKRRLKEVDEMEILMGLIDMKVVSRVLRMPEISEEQLRWCEEKMNKVRVWDGKLQRDSSPLFFPVH